LKSRASRKGGDERKKKSQRKCYECGEYGHFIAKCPKNKNKNEEEKKFKERSKEYKNKYQERAHVGQQWDSSDEDEEPKKQGMATVAMAQGSSSPRLFNNSPMMKTTLTFASWQGGVRYKNLPSHLLQSPLHPHLVVT
jgi:hypothetical protein